MNGIEAVTTTLTAMEKLKLLRNAKHELIMRNKDVQKDLWESDAERVALQVQKSFLEGRADASLSKVLLSFGLTSVPPSSYIRFLPFLDDLTYLNRINAHRVSFLRRNCAPRRRLRRSTNW